MGWLGTFFIAVLTAALGALLSGIVASLAVDWYRISSFEGGSGYFVVFIALAGLLGGFLIGGITARVVAGGAQPGFGKGLGYALLIVLLLAGAVAGISRWLADVPPTRQGERLMLLVEVRWPAAQQHSPASDPVVRVLENKYFVDEGVDFVLIRPLRWFGNLLWKLFDVIFIDGIGVQTMISPEEFTPERQTHLVDALLDRLFTPTP